MAGNHRGGARRLADRLAAAFAERTAGNLPVGAEDVRHLVREVQAPRSVEEALLRLPRRASSQGWVALAVLAASVRDARARDSGPDSDPEAEQDARVQRPAPRLVGGRVLEVGRQLPLEGALSGSALSARRVGVAHASSTPLDGGVYPGSRTPDEESPGQETAAGVLSYRYR